jgi:hypothetical protein
MLNYETKSPDSLKSLKNPITPAERSEGIAVMDVDPVSGRRNDPLAKQFGCPPTFSITVP